MPNTYCVRFLVKLDKSVLTYRNLYYKMHRECSVTVTFSNITIVDDGRNKNDKKDYKDRGRTL